MDARGGTATIATDARPVTPTVRDRPSLLVSFTDGGHARPVAVRSDCGPLAPTPYRDTYAGSQRIRQDVVDMVISSAPSRSVPPPPCVQSVRLPHPRSLRPPPRRPLLSECTRPPCVADLSGQSGPWRASTGGVLRPPRARETSPPLPPALCRSSRDGRSTAHEASARSSHSTHHQGNPARAHPTASKSRGSAA